MKMKRPSSILGTKRKKDKSQKEKDLQKTSSHPGKQKMTDDPDNSEDNTTESLHLYNTFEHFDETREEDIWVPNLFQDMDTVMNGFALA